MNYRQLKKYLLFDNKRINEYGEQEKSTSHIAVIEAWIVEEEKYAMVDNITSLISNYYGLTFYKGCKPNMILESGEEKYRIVSCVNSTRKAQLRLLKI
ncbi:MAG: hypothetical protein WBI36_07500 [Erysipelotrichaceae bacterium]|jgi:vacuolar-type H+-ATPase subunit I/STV1